MAINCFKPNWNGFAISQGGVQTTAINSSCKSWGIVNFLSKQNCQKGHRERS